MILKKMNLESFNQFDYAVFQHINSWAGQWSWLDVVMVGATHLGIPLLGLYMLYMCFANEKKDEGFWTIGRKQVAYIVIAWGISLLLSNGIEHMWFRARPFVVHTVTLLTPHSANASMPSSHALTAFVFATGIARYSRKYSGWAFGVAGVVALSRCYVGVHYPADILVGAILGIICTWAVSSLAEMAVACHRVKEIHSDKEIRETAVADRRVDAYVKEVSTMDLKTIKEVIKSDTYRQFKKRALAGVLTIAVLGGVGAGGVHYYEHQQKIKVRQAQSELIRTEAAAHQLTLLDESVVKEKVAALINADMGAVNFKKVALFEGRKDDKHYEAKGKYKDNGRKNGDRPDHRRMVAAVDDGNRQQYVAGGKEVTGEEMPNAALPAEMAKETILPRPMDAMHPLYKVKAVHDGLEYEVVMDAVNGMVLKSEVEQGSLWDV